MPAPKRPNTAAATEAVRRRGQETMAARLREAGWTVIPPELVQEDTMTTYTIKHMDGRDGGAGVWTPTGDRTTIEATSPEDAAQRAFDRDGWTSADPDEQIWVWVGADAETAKKPTLRWWCDSYKRGGLYPPHPVPGVVQVRQAVEPTDI